MKIVVTGALGHIGSKLIRELPRHLDNPTVVMIDDLSTQRYSSLFDLPQGASYKFVESRLQDCNLADVLEGTNVVVHLAAMTDAAGTADKPDLVHQNNFASTKLLADACLKANVPILFPSSTSVYGSQSELVDETCVDLQPQSPYADCKIKEENYLRDLFAKGLRGVICRFGTIYGVSRGMRFHTAVNKFCFQAVTKQPVTVWETALHQKRPYLDLGDCCDSMIWMIKNGIFDGEVYNIVSNNFTVNDVLDEIRKYIPTLEVKLVQHKIMNQLSYEASAIKFAKKGFDFQGSFSKGIKETIALLANANS